MYVYVYVKFIILIPSFHCFYKQTLAFVVLGALLILEFYSTSSYFISGLLPLNCRTRLTGKSSDTF